MMTTIKNPRTLRRIRHKKHQKNQYKSTPEKEKEKEKKKKKTTATLFSPKMPSIEALNLDPPQPELDPPQSGNLPDLDLPIAVPKGTRSCVTHHPIQNFVSQHYLSPTFHAHIIEFYRILHPFELPLIPKPIGDRKQNNNSFMVRASARPQL